MTFKTDIKFDESPVLRSLEKVAIDKGLVKPDPITKEASASETYAPTGDLHEDMLKLVAGLRAKGFEKEAEELEDKINMRKFAETDLYHVIDEEGDDLLDFAHPEGDVEVAPSASGLGKVWTEQSAKKEIEKIVRKQPTGKYAARGADIKKRAAEFDEDQINQDIASLYDELHAAKEAAKAGLGAVPRYWTFSEDDILSNDVRAEFYSELSGVSAEAIGDYKSLLKAAGGTDANTIYSMIVNGNTWKELGRLTGTNYFWGSKPYDRSAWEWATSFRVYDKPKGEWGDDNKDAVLYWTGSQWGKDGATARRAAKQIESIIKQKREAIFGKNLAAASKAVLERAKKYEALVDKAFGKLEVPMLERDENDSLAKSAASILANVRKIGTNVMSLKSEAIKRRYEKLVEKFGSGPMSWKAFDLAIDTAMDPLGSLAEKLQPIAAKGPTKTAANNFAKAAAIFASYIAWLESEGYQDAPEYAASKRGMEKSRQYAAVVNDGVKKGKMTRAYNLIQVDSDEALLAASNSWLESVQQYTGMTAPMKAEAPAKTEAPAEADDAVYAATDAEMIKSAQLAFDPGGGGGAKPKAPTAPRKPSSPRRPGTQPSAGAGSTFKQQQPRGGRSFAFAIQQELLKLAKLLESIQGNKENIKLLKMEPYGADKMWGKATKDALAAAERTRKDVETRGVKKTTPIAVENTQATVDNLKALNAAVDAAIKAGGAGMKQGQVYDELSNGQKVTSMSLVSPRSFYEFMIVAMPTKRQIDTESGLEVVDIKTFESFVKHLLGRARVMYKESTSDEVTKRAGSYIRALKELWAQWEGVLNNVAKQFGGGKGSKITADYVRQVGKIYASSLDTGGPDFGRGEGPGAGTGLRQERGPGGGIRIELAGDGEGRAGEVPEDVVPPITRYINLGDATYWNLDLQVILDYNEFRRMSGTEFANVFFSGEEETIETPGAARRLPPLDNAVWDEAARRAGWPVVKYNPRDRQFYIQVQGAGRGERGPWAGRWIPAKDDPYTRRQLPEQATPARATTITANDRALNFLRDFRAAITRVYKDWASNVLSGNYEKRKEFSTLILGQARRWQKKISRMENDIKRANMRARRR